MITVAAKGGEAERVAWRAHDLLDDEQMLRTTTSDIMLEAGEGRLVLSGRVRTNIMRNLAGRLAKAAANGWQLENRLVSDESLALSIATQLALDPRTADAAVRCEVFLGVAHLKGTVHSLAQREVVLALASEVDGVSGVKDLLTVKG